MTMLRMLVITAALTICLAALFGAREQAVDPLASQDAFENKAQVIKAKEPGQVGRQVAQEAQADQADQADAPGRFEAIDLYIDPGQTSLAAYQLELRDPAGRIAIVGIEGGEHAAFHQPPYYDPRAIQNDHVILAAFSLAPPADLPAGKTRVATIHVHVSGDQPVQYQVELTTVAAHDGSPIQASLRWQKGDPQ